MRQNTKHEGQKKGLTASADSRREGQTHARKQKHEGQKKGWRRRTADGRDKPMRENGNMKDKRRGGVGGQPTGGTNPCEKTET